MRGRLSHPADLFTILIVCTGNVCRSPLAERLARAFLDEALGEEDAARIRVASAGTGAGAGAAMDASTELVLRGLGGNPAKFWSQPLNADLARRADLTLTMTREHRGDVLALAPRALSRTFTIKEAADLLAGVHDSDIGGDTLSERARALVAAMAAARVGRRGGDADDVADPIGRPLAFHEEVGEAIAGALLPLLERIAALAEKQPTLGNPPAGTEGAGGEHRAERLGRVS